MTATCGPSSRLCGHHWQDHSRKGAPREGVAGDCQADQEPGHLRPWLTSRCPAWPRRAV